MSELTDTLRSRLAGLRLTPEREADIIEEVSVHLEERVRELEAEGHDATTARVTALSELDVPGALASRLQLLRQAHAPERLTPGEPRRRLATDLWRDLRYALRMLRKAPGFAAAAIVTLALGVGANAAIFALADATLLRALPFAGADRLVMVWERTDDTPRGLVSPRNMLDWIERSDTLEAIGAFRFGVGGMVLGDTEGLPDTVPRQWVTAGIFETLGVKVIAGRTFRSSDDEQRANVVVLSEGFWRARFNGDTNIVGRPIRLDGDLYTVLGVVADDAQVIGRASIWALVPIHGASPASRSQYALLAIGRLRPGVDLAAAQEEISGVAAGLAREFPDTNTGRDVVLEPLREAVFGNDLRATALLFLAVVGLVLLICCANVANLLLARSTVRRHEFAIRVALGADRWRVIRQLLTESVVLAAVGAGLGLGVGAAILRAVPAFVPPGMLPSVMSLALDVRVVAFCAVTALLVGVLFGLAPAWQASTLATARTTAGTRTTTDRGGRMRRWLVAGQVATAVVLLVGAGLLLRTLLTLDGIDRGYRAERVLSMVVDPPSSAYPGDAEELQFYQSVEDEIRGLPGVRGVAWATTLPLGRSYQGPRVFDIVGEPLAAASQPPTADLQIVSRGYFDALDVPVVDGRGFDVGDVEGSVPVCLVNEAFVRRYFGGASPVGRQVALRPTAGSDGAVDVREIVGVARQVRGRSTETEDFVQVYVPLAQQTPGDIYLLVTPDTGAAAALATPVRTAIGRVDRSQLVSVRDVLTLDEVAAEGHAGHRFRAVLVVAFASLALLLAMIGLFGILAYSVQRRARDFGVRRALGASTRHIFTLVAGEAGGVIVVGAVAGLVLSYVSSRLLAAMLYGVQPLDPMTFVAVALVIGLSASAAVIGPAWRAARVDPATALRQE